MKKLSDEDFKEMMKRHEKGERIKDLANEFGVSSVSFYKRRLLYKKSFNKAKPVHVKKGPRMMAIPLAPQEADKVIIILSTPSGAAKVIGDLWK